MHLAFKNMIDQYFEKKSRWYKGFVELLGNNKELDKWNFPFFKTFNKNGDYDMDGNPIFSMIRFDNSKIIKIIHDEESDDPNFILSTFDDIPMLICVSNLNHIKIVLEKSNFFMLNENNAR